MGDERLLRYALDLCCCAIALLGFASGLGLITPGVALAGIFAVLAALLIAFQRFD